MHASEIILAKPGHALVGMKPRYGDQEDQIVIPGSARSRKTIGRLGIVCSVNPYPEGRDSVVFENGKKVARPAYLQNDSYISLLGKFVICRNAALVQGCLYSVRLEFIESTGCEGVEPSEAEVPRCLQCKSEGEANILLGPDGYCPVCGLNKYGEHVNDIDLRAMLMKDEELMDNLIRMPTEAMHRARGGGAVHGKIISFAGQKNRSAVQPVRLAPNIRRILK